MGIFAKHEEASDLVTLTPNALLYALENHAANNTQKQSPKPCQVINVMQTRMRLILFPDLGWEKEGLDFASPASWSSLATSASVGVGGQRVAIPGLLLVNRASEAYRGTSVTGRIRRGGSKTPVLGVGRQVAEIVVKVRKAIGIVLLGFADLRVVVIPPEHLVGL